MRKSDWAADFSVFDERGQLAAIAEAKGEKNADVEWAWDWLRFRLENERLPGPPFVLLATRDTMFLWKHGPDDTWPEPVTADARRILAPYVSPRLDLGTMSGSTFEFLVGAWLDASAHGHWEPDTPDQVHMLVDTGFFDVLKNGRVASQILA
jgi:hypothetical protein